MHFSAVETLPYVLGLIIISSFEFPLTTLILSCFYLLGRILYTIGYINGGPNMSRIGGIPNLLIVITLIVLAMIGVCKVV